MSRSLKPVILGLCLLAAGCDRQSAAPAQPEARPASGKNAAAQALTGTIDHSHKGSRMPDFTFADPAGNRLRLADLAGRPFLLNLWATWCAPCVTEMPTLDALAGTMAGRMRVVTISQDMQGAAKVAPFFSEKAFRKLEPWLDPQNELGFHYGGATLPMTVLYDAQGREVWRMAGGYDWSGSEAKALVEEAFQP